MRVEFIKEYTDDRGRVFPKGKKIHLSKDFGKELIKSKHAKQIGLTNEFKELEKKLEKIGVEIK